MNERPGPEGDFGQALRWGLGLAFAGFWLPLALLIVRCAS